MELQGSGCVAFLAFYVSWAAGLLCTALSREPAADLDHGATAGPMFFFGQSKA